MDYMIHKYRSKDFEIYNYVICDANAFAVTPKCVTDIGYFKIGNDTRVIHKCDTFLEVCTYILNSEQSTLEDTLKYMKFKNEMEQNETVLKKVEKVSKMSQDSL